ncbi:hypothetical protein BGZ57DRAFT_535332 [Hyaloscypha finlandica]|nr:hypothetical protein BGZ57DRAFT_535332 [Hyaloscypha finlandica]
MICLDEPSRTIVKSPHGEENKDDLAIEKRIYERFSELGGHEGLLHYHGPYELGIRLEFACNGNLRSFLKRRAKDIDIERRLRWAKQIADALRFVRMASTSVQPNLCKASLIFPPPVLQNSHATDLSPYLLMRTDYSSCPLPLWSGPISLS